MPVLIMGLKVLAILGLLFLLFIIGALTLLGDTFVPIICGIVLLAVGVGVYKWWFHSKLKASTYTCILLLAVSILVGLSAHIVAAPRPLSRQERNDILTYLEIQYPSQDFRIVSARVHRVTIGGGFTPFTPRRWNEIEAIVADSDGVRFEVVGRDDGTNFWGGNRNINMRSTRLVQTNSTFMLGDSYSVIPQRFPIRDMEDEIWDIVMAHQRLFDYNRIDGRSRRVEISLAPMHIEVRMTVHYSHIIQSDFDSSVAEEKVRIVRNEIEVATGFESVALNARFRFRDEENWVRRDPRSVENLLISSIVDAFSYDPDTGLLAFTIPDMPQEFSLRLSIHYITLVDEIFSPNFVFEDEKYDFSWQPNKMYTHRIDPDILQHIEILIGLVPSGYEERWSSYMLNMTSVMIFSNGESRRTPELRPLEDD